MANWPRIRAGLSLVPLLCAAVRADPIGTDVGSKMIFEDAFSRVWEMRLKPGESSPVHRHDLDYTFVVQEPAVLRILSPNGTGLFDFTAEGTFGFRVRGDFLVPTQKELPWPLPRTHAAQNVDNRTFYEFIFENKVSTNRTWPVKRNFVQRLWSKMRGGLKQEL